MSRPPRLCVLLTALLAATAPLVACSDDTAAPGPTADATTSTTATPPTTPPPAPTPTPEEEVEAAYVAIMARYFERLGAPDPSHPDVPRDHEGQSLELVLDVLTNYVEQGLHSAPGPSGSWPATRVLTVDVQGDRATLTACHVDDSVVQEVGTKKVINDATVSKLTEATLVLRDDNWVLTKHATVSEWLDNQGCRE